MISIDKKYEEAKLKMTEIDKVLNSLKMKESELWGEKLRIEGELRILTELKEARTMKESEDGTDRDTRKD